MKEIRWGIIGCGDVTEIKSGPAFQKADRSALVAVMRRDLEKAKQYAEKHQVPRYYNDATALINDPEVNAVYIATPPSSHEQHALAAIAAGKPVYIEKPMTVDFSSASGIVAAAAAHQVKLTVAHYRRAQPIFKKIKQLLEEKAIGDIQLISLEYFRKPLTEKELTTPRIAWRVDAEIAGGGLFHDLAPHQLDLINYFFGNAQHASGYAANQSKLYKADDLVIGNLIFNQGFVFNGIWFFSAPEEEEKDIVEIIGTKGKISFSVFQMKQFEIASNGTVKQFTFEDIPHVQQPLIEKVVDYFLDNGPNPCSGEDGAYIMKIMDIFTKANDSRMQEFG